MKQRSWRIVKARYADGAFSGEGARRYGGRWTSPGAPIVYTAEHASLAVLEVLVHLASPRALASYVILSVDFDSKLVTRLREKDLPDGWRASPPIQALRQIGDDWATARSSAVLEVPSAVVPLEHTYLLNPSHPDFGHLSLGAPQPFYLDARLT